MTRLPKKILTRANEFPAIKFLMVERRKLYSRKNSMRLSERKSYDRKKKSIK
jgi:hypothetical protein